MTTTDHTAMSDRAVSYLRTIVPTVWGALVVTVLRVLGPHLPGDVGAALGDVLSSELVLTFVVSVAIAVWYWLWRRLERHVPDWLVRLVLGSARTPGYALTPVAETSDGAHVVTTLTRDEAALISDIRATENRLRTERSSDAE